MGTALYQLIIQPLVVLLEFSYELFVEVLHSKGIAVIGLSFVVTLATLPLYMVAESWQDVERKKVASMAGKVARIKKAFKGDEQFMILSAYYKEQHYKPIYALRSSFSLLIQIPFFIAAYNYLSSLEPLRGYSFLGIPDFGAPDGMLRLGSVSLNLLPIAMTLINCVAGYIYSKGHPRREQIQIYVCALVFLVLLYDSPAGLVLYWTMNNVLSLVKNIFYKLKHPARVLYVLLCVFAALCVCLGLFVLGRKTVKLLRLGLVCGGLVLPFVPFALVWLRSFVKKHFADFKETSALFWTCAVALALLCGLVIPSTLMESEPAQYCYVDGYTSPMVFIAYVLLQSFGLFVFWPGCFYLLFGKDVKREFALLSVLALLVAVVDVFGFSGSYGPIEPTLIFMENRSMVPSLRELLAHFLICVVLCVLVCVLVKKRPGIVISLGVVVVLAFASLSVKNLASVQNSYRHMEKPAVASSVDPVFHLSKTGKNVIVLMQDRCFSPMIDEVFDVQPQLKDEFDGFVFYPNATSFGKYTMLGTPALYGGYDYTPFEMNRRHTKSMREKHNEALLTMPVLFGGAGWETTVSDLPYENYALEPVEDMYKDYPEIRRVLTHAVYSDYWYAKHGLKRSPYLSFLIKRNFLLFGVFKMVPPILRRVVYHHQYWISYNPYDNSSRFVDNFSELDLLPELTDFTAKGNSFTILDNETTHEPVLLQAPDYMPVSGKVTDIGEGKWAGDPLFSTMTGVFLRLGAFFQYLKDNGVYDNTRIIIVSDHGTSMATGAFDPERFPFPKENVTATLMVKDFGSHGSLTSDSRFMTNADVPALAVKDIVSNPFNPFTRRPLEVQDKGSYVKISNAPAESTRIRDNTKFDISRDEWFVVRDDIFDDANWGRYEGPLPETMPVEY